jgi:L-ascorbate metabolism protein UlaG (beta-lactamase superfamily)
MLRLTFLSHSGFAVETDSKVLVFDYHVDPAHCIASYARGTKPLWFFVSHWHQDHFNRHIADFQDRSVCYIVNKDVRLKGVAPEKLKSLAVYDTIQVEDTVVTQYGSTDEGGSFLVETDGLSVFHAGDLNWWHWLGDTDENNAEAKDNFDREMKHLTGKQFDVAFFPVDARLEGAREWGVQGFLDTVNVRKCLVPMHYFGAPWIPSPTYKKQYGTTKLWIPVKSGDFIDI